MAKRHCSPLTRLTGSCCSGILPSGEDLAACCDNGIRRLALFGSILRDDFHPGSDIDVLVEFRPDARVGYLAIAKEALDEYLAA